MEYLGGGSALDLVSHTVAFTVRLEFYLCLYGVNKWDGCASIIMGAAPLSFRNWYYT